MFIKYNNKLYKLERVMGKKEGKTQWEIIGISDNGEILKIEEWTKERRNKNE